MSRRDQIKMTDSEIADYLAEQRTLQVASLNADGTPHLVAMYYAVVDGRIGFWTYEKSQKVVNLRRDPRLTVMVESGSTYADLRGVTVTGTARIVDDGELVREFGEVLYPLYNGELTEPAKLGVARSAAKRVVVYVDATKTVSWDHTKLGSAY
jgi:PPOX class probable F420-dependent enzyme